MKEHPQRCIMLSALVMFTLKEAIHAYKEVPHFIRKHGVLTRLKEGTTCFKRRHCMLTLLQKETRIKTSVPGPPHALQCSLAVTSTHMPVSSPQTTATALRVGRRACSEGAWQP